ncbi:hypothetical protein D9M72_474540 [compost metagenome]
MATIGSRQLYDGHFIASDFLNDLLIEVSSNLVDLRIFRFPIVLEPIQPIARIEHSVQREHELLEFQLLGREVPLGLPPKRLPYLPIRAGHDDRIFEIGVGNQSFPHIHIEEPRIDSPLRVSYPRRDGGKKGLKKGGHTLLSIQQQQVRLYARKARPLDAPWLEVDLTATLEDQQGTDGVAF